MRIFFWLGIIPIAIIVLPFIRENHNFIKFQMFLLLVQTVSAIIWVTYILNA